MVGFKSFLEEQDTQRIDVLKMDIEGGEYSILYSLSAQHFQKIDKIFIEIHEIDEEQNNARSLIQYLGSFYNHITNDGAMIYYLSNK